ncbi:MAG: radical SAM protein [Treponema sp.]|nr:radical SAM protein [Treponema sp.]
MNVTIIQPPLVQLNTPYPSGAYLKSFFQMIRDGKVPGLSPDLIENVRWLDLSTALFHKIFCRQGLTKLFALTEKKALSMADSSDEETAFQLRRYVSCQALWINWIDRIVEILCGGNSAREFCHEFVRSPHAPRGNRMENFFGELSEQGRDITTDDAKILASLALADLADYITAVFDSDFRLISYAEHLGTSTASFDDVIKGLKSPVLNEFYKDVLLEVLEPDHLFLISVPFPGCFEAAVFTAREIKKLYGEKAIIATGGGYINTELRNLSEIRFFDYFDFISYDMGYGSYIHLLENISESRETVAAHDAALTHDLSSVIGTLNEAPLYKMKYRNSGKIIGQSDVNGDLKKYAELESKVCRVLIPDFSEINFSKYPRLADDTNPMHSIWNDGAWLKSYMAHGCYWHRCAFCDTQLEYVNRFCKVGASHLCDGLTEQAQKTGVWGIHFVDEACPPSSMIDFGIRNCQNENVNGKKLTWWGNIRFEKTFTRDMADFLSYSGLTAVSGGIEIATGDGLNAVNKGTTIENIVAATCAFKEAGILVHSYMIFGFYQQSEQDLINSMETLRQLFKAGLLDSAFWHKFTLTLHSTVYKEWQEGKHPDLKIITGNEESRNRFAENDLHFAGENKSEKYSAGLNAALDAWMHGQNLDTNVQRWFNFNMPRPTLPKDYIDKLIEKYEARRDAAYRETVSEKSRLFWLGGKPVVQGENLTWFFMGQELSGHFAKAKEIAAILETLQPGEAPKGAQSPSPRAHSATSDAHNASQDALGKLCSAKELIRLRRGGLCCL